MSFYGQAMWILPDENGQRTTYSFFMSYHTAVKTSYDFYSSLKQARAISDDIQSNIIERDSSAVFFPYRYIFETLKIAVSD